MNSWNSFCGLRFIFLIKLLKLLFCIKQFNNIKTVLWSTNNERKYGSFHLWIAINFYWFIKLAQCTAYRIVPTAKLQLRNETVVLLWYFDLPYFQGMHNAHSRQSIIIIISRRRLLLISLFLRMQRGNQYAWQMDCILRTSSGCCCKFPEVTISFVYIYDIYGDGVFYS